MKHLISVPFNSIPYFTNIAGLPKDDWHVSSDPDGKKAGSGGGTANLLSELWKKEDGPDFYEWLAKEKRVVINSGGKSRRLPAYAHLGKSLLPMPVFRWSRGQDLNQRLINLQLPLLDKILEKAPENLNTLVASGDVLVFEGKRLPEIPEADVVCFGLWLEPEKAANHGVFFSKHESPGKPEFVLQKPPEEKIRKLIGDYYFLMDIGIWLLSPKAVDILMRRSGWNGKIFINGVADEYDLYGEFGTALGSLPSVKDQEINDLKVALINLEGGSFYHLGSTSDLIFSNMAIQNRVNDPRKILQKTIKPHPSIFVLNTDINIKWNTSHKNIWIENSYIPDSWTLTKNHAITGIPENNWSLKIHKGYCLDIVLLNKETVAIRNYGFSDKFAGKFRDPGTLFMNEPLIKWLEKRRIEMAFNGMPENTDIHSLPLFPVMNKKEVDDGFLQWLLNKEPAVNEKFQKLWIEAERLSADEISNKDNESRYQRERFLTKILPVLAKNFKHSVFYQLDLTKLATDYLYHIIDLPPELPDNVNGWIPAHDKMFRAYYARERGWDYEIEEINAFLYMRELIMKSFTEHGVYPGIELLPDQIAWGRSPVRFDLAGGWTDTPPYCMYSGGAVLNLAAELNGQPPLHCYVKRHDSPEFVLNSIDLGEREVVTSYEDLRSFFDIRSAFAIPKAALGLAGFLPEFCTRKFSSLKEQLEKSGGGLEISVLAAVPKGSGLGTSSILAATILGTLSEVCCLGWDKMETGRRTMALEQMLTTGGGWQDQYGGLLDGVKFLETAPGIQQYPVAKWLPDSIFTDVKYKNRWLLYYTGITRVAKNILSEIVRGMLLNSSGHLNILNELKDHAAAVYETMLKKDFDALGRQVLRSWELNQRLDEGTNTPEIQKIIDQIEPFATGYKLPGAGGGGFVLIMAKDEDAAARIKKELTTNAVNPRARFIDFSISPTGFQVTKS